MDTIVVLVSGARSCDCDPGTIQSYQVELTGLAVSRAALNVLTKWAGETQCNVIPKYDNS